MKNSGSDGELQFKKKLKSLVEIRKVWRVIKRALIQEGPRLVKSKWVVDIQRGGLFKVLVACRYSQVLGVDFTESYAQVINDVSWRILIKKKLAFLET